MCRCEGVCMCIYMCVTVACSLLAGYLKKKGLSAAGCWVDWPACPSSGPALHQYPGRSVQAEGLAVDHQHVKTQEGPLALLLSLLKEGLQ